MEMQTLLTVLRRLLFVDMLLSLIIECLCGIGYAEKMITPPLPVWTLLRNGVLLGTVGMCILVIVRLPQCIRPKMYWYSILGGIFSLACSLLPGLLWPASPEILWSVLSYGIASLSCITLLSAEYTFYTQKKSSRFRQQKKASAKRAYPALAYHATSKGQEQAASVETTRTFFQESRKMDISSDPPLILLFHSSKDSSWAEKCRKQLGVFKVRSTVTLWDENTIFPGAVRQDELEQALAFAKVAILLVSADFLDECVTQLECILRCQQNRPDFWVCPVIVGACVYEQSPLCEFHPYWFAGNTAKEPLHNLPLPKQNESFCELARLITQQLSKEPSSEENARPKEPACITTEDKVQFLQVRAILEKEGLLNHTFHSQYNNGEYLRILQDSILYPNPEQELIDWVRDAMRIIIEDDKRVSSQRNCSV